MSKNKEDKSPPVIDHRLLRLMVGCIGLTLGGLTEFITDPKLPSISASYHLGGRDFFVGSLCFIGTFLVVYQGHNCLDKWLSRIAGLSALLVAFFPTSDPRIDPPPSSPIHYGSAVVLFLILTYFCLYAFKRKIKNSTKTKHRIRKSIYNITGVTMVICIIVIGLDKFVEELFTSETIVFWGETVSLFAFGIAWITASKLPLLANKDESYNPFNKCP